MMLSIPSSMGRSRLLFVLQLLLFFALISNGHGAAEESDSLEDRLEDPSFAKERVVWKKYSVMKKVASTVKTEHDRLINANGNYKLAKEFLSSARHAKWSSPAEVKKMEDELRNLKDEIFVSATQLKGVVQEYNKAVEELAEVFMKSEMEGANASALGRSIEWARTQIMHKLRSLIEIHNSLKE